jgi:lysine 6-dehydrogenase
MASLISRGRGKDSKMSSGNSKRRVFAVLGAGKQGTAAAYDFLKFGNAEEVILGDARPDAAEGAAVKLRSLLPDRAERIRARRVDATDAEALVEFLEPAHTLLSAVPYFMHPSVAVAAIAARTNMCDLGGNTGVALKVLALDDEAKKSGVTLVPDAGLAPGMVNTLAVYGMEGMDACREVQLRCGGLPQNRRPPLDYKLVFAISGLTVEYFGKAHVIRNGKVVEVETFNEVEPIEFAEPVGLCEAFVTSGGSSTAPLTFEGKVDRYEYKTVRYPGHHAKFKVIKELGLLDLEPVRVGDTDVVPRELFHTVAAPKIDFPEDRDLVVVRAVVRGVKDGRPIRRQMDIMDFHDEETGFSAMERTTGFSAAIVCEMIADGVVEPGAHSLEQVIPGKPFVDALVARGIPFTETTTIVRS